MLTRIFRREKLQSKSRAIKTLDYAMSGTAGTDMCANFVEVLGLKTLFAAFMGKVDAAFIWQGFK
jgi:beta-catenin-like protein 1